MMGGLTEELPCLGNADRGYLPATLTRAIVRFRGHLVEQEVLALNVKPQYAEGPDFGTRLLQQLSSCLHQALPSSDQALISPLLALFEVGVQAGYILAHQQVDAKAVAKPNAGTCPHGAAMMLAGEAQMRPCLTSGDGGAATAASSSCTTPASGAGQETGLLYVMMGRDSTDDEAGLITAAGMATAAATGSHPMPTDVRSSTGGSALCPAAQQAETSHLLKGPAFQLPAGHPGVDWSQPIPPSAAGGCPFMAVLTARRAGSAAPVGAGAPPRASMPNADMLVGSAVAGEQRWSMPGVSCPLDMEHEAPLAQSAEPLADLLAQFPSMGDALYSKLGSWDGLVAAVDCFYMRVMSDERLKSCYAHVPARSYMTRKLSCFLAFACSGRLPYGAHTLWSRHSKIIQAFQLTPEDVDLFAKHLHDALEDVGIHPDVIEMSTKLVLQYRDLFDPSVTAASFGPEAGPQLPPRACMPGALPQAQPDLMHGTH